MRCTFTRSLGLCTVRRPTCALPPSGASFSRCEGLFLGHRTWFRLFRKRGPRGRRSSAAVGSECARGGSGPRLVRHGINERSPAGLAPPAAAERRAPSAESTSCAARFMEALSCRPLSSFFQGSSSDAVGQLDTKMTFRVVYFLEEIALEQLPVRLHSPAFKRRERERHREREKKKKETESPHPGGAHAQLDDNSAERNKSLPFPT